MNLDELRQIRETKARELSLRSGEARVKILVGMGTSGIAAGAREVLETLRDEVDKLDLCDVTVGQTGERGLSSEEPLVEVKEAEGTVVTYGSMTRDKARRVVSEHIVQGNPVSEYAIELRAS